MTDEASADPSADRSADQSDGPSLGLRLAALVGIVAVLAITVAYVVRSDIDRRQADDAATAATVTTYEPPPPGSSPVSTPGTTPGTGATTPGTLGPVRGSALAIELEKVVRRDTGWTHKVWCTPSEAVVPGDVLACRATTEPPIDFQPDSMILVVVVDDDGTAIFTRGREGPVTIEALQADAGKDCAALADAGYSYAAVVAFQRVTDAGEALVEAGADAPAVVDLAPALAPLPCTVTYGDAVAETFDAALG